MLELPAAAACNSVEQCWLEKNLCRQTGIPLYPQLRTWSIVCYRFGTTSQVLLQYICSVILYLCEQL